MIANRKILAKDVKEFLSNENTKSEGNLPGNCLNRNINNELCDIFGGDSESGTNENSSHIEKIDDARGRTSFTIEELQQLLEESKTTKRKKVVANFIGKLTLHGYPNFHDARGIRKVLWGIVLLVMCVLIYRLAYLSYRPENRHKQIIELLTKKMNAINYPTITMCNYNPVYSTEVYESFPVNVTEKEFRLFYLEMLSNRRDWEFVNDDLTARVLAELKRKGYTTYTDVLQLFEKNKQNDINSYFVRKVMQEFSCLYENKKCDFKKDFKRVYRLTSQSLCLQFNSYETGKESLVSTGSDLENGFTMHWDISGENYFYNYGIHGLLLEVHPYGTPHHLIDHRNTIYLEPGAFTNIDIEEVETKRLPPPFVPNCGERELEFIKNYTYSNAICEVDCYLEMIINSCGCVIDQFAKYVQEFPICNVTDMPCVFSASQETHCHSCPVKCDAVHYHISTSRLGIGNEAIYHVLQDTKAWGNKTKEEMMLYAKNNVVGFRIGYKSLEVQQRNYEEAMPWFDRVSLLGGTVSLLMGLSMTTCFEFLFFVVDYITITIKYVCAKKYLIDMLKKEVL